MLCNSRSGMLIRPGLALKMAVASAKLASSPDEAADVTAERDVTPEGDVPSEGDVSSEVDTSTFAEADGSTSRSAALLICQKSILTSGLDTSGAVHTVFKRPESWLTSPSGHLWRDKWTALREHSPFCPGSFWWSRPPPGASCTILCF